MRTDRFVGPATFVYLAASTVAALWWASDLTRRVDTIERSTVTAERIARLEAEVGTLAENTKDLKVSINDLMHELQHR